MNVSEMSVETRWILPKIPPHEAVGERFRPKTTRKTPKYACNLDGSNLAKIKTQRVDHDAQQKLLNALAKRKSARDHHDRHWVQLEETGNTLRSNLFEFEVFLKENEGKRRRKRAEIIHFQQMQRKYDAGIEDLKIRTEFLSSIKSKMETQITNHGFYEDFIRNAAQRSIEFSTVNEVIVRYDLLRDSRRVIHENQMGLRGKLYGSFSAVESIVKQMNAAQLGLCNEVGKMVSRYEAAKTRSLRWENVLSSVLAEMSRRLGEVAMVTSACRNIHRDICARRNLKPVREEDFRGQLKSIKEELRYMKMTLKGS